MNQTFIILLIIFVFTSCNQQKKSDENKNVDTVAIATINTQLINQSTPTATLECSIFKFKNIKQQADTLLKYVNKQQLVADQRFFCAFPNSFNEMQNIFGFDVNKGQAPLYKHPNGVNMIGYFANLNSIPKEIYYDKYINICLDGVWEADNIREAFGFAARLTNDTEAVCSSLSKKSDKQIKSVFHFIFDGPHPKNKENEKIYNVLLPILTKQNKRLGNLLKESFNKVMREDDGHGH